MVPIRIRPLNKPRVYPVGEDRRRHPIDPFNYILKTDPLRWFWGLRSVRGRRTVPVLVQRGGVEPAARR